MFFNEINKKYWLTNLIEDTRGYDFYIHPEDLLKLLVYKHKKTYIFEEEYNDPIELFTPIRLAKGKQYIKIDTSNIKVYKSDFDRNYYTLGKIEIKDILGGITWDKNFKKSDPKIFEGWFENTRKTELSDLIYKIYNINCGYLKDNFNNTISIFYKRDYNLDIFQKEIDLLFSIYGYKLNRNSNYIYYEKCPEYEISKYDLKQNFSNFCILTSEYEIENNINNEFIEPNSPFIEGTIFVFYGDRINENIEAYQNLIKHTIKNYEYSFRVIPENFDQNQLMPIDLDYEIKKYLSFYDIDRFYHHFDNNIKWYKIKDYDIIYTRDKIKNPNYIENDK